jgi:hypothetical protein
VGDVGEARAVGERQETGEEGGAPSWTAAIGEAGDPPELRAERPGALQPRISRASVEDPSNTRDPI